MKKPLLGSCDSAPHGGRVLQGIGGPTLNVRLMRAAHNSEQTAAAREIPDEQAEMGTVKE